jgi:parvulin-like peptidyl-prolyl isomerase
MSTYFAEHRLELERVGLYSCRVETEAKAEELIELIREGESFLAIAAAHSTDSKTSAKGGFVGLLSREDVSPEIESILFGAPVNQPIGPVKTREGFNIFLVTDQIRPTLNEMRPLLRDYLLNETLKKLAASASIDFPCINLTSDARR